MKIPTLLLLLLVLGCNGESTKVEIIPGVQQVGTIAPEIRESSGIAASRRHADVFWTHNDHGSKPVLYGIKRSGELIAKYGVKGPKLTDWEDIATDGNGSLYLADIGNNDSKRSELFVHRVVEPDPKAAATELVPNRSWTLRFPGKPFDCESLFVFGTNAFVISKVFDDARAAIYRFQLSEMNTTATLELVAETSIESPVTSAEVSNNGRLLGIVSKAGPFVYRIDGDVSRVRSEKPYRIRFKDRNIEACTFVPEGLLATSESREIYLFSDREFQAER